MVNFDGIGLFGMGPLSTIASPILQPGFLLASAEGSGFGLNLDILESNIINLAIIIGILVYYGRGIVGNILGERRSAIETAIREAEERKKTAVTALAEEQQKLAQAQTDAARILQEAEQSADKARAAILAEAEEELARMRQAASQDITTQQERIARELRERIANLALEKAEATLRSDLNPDAQHQLVDQSIASLGGRV